MAHPNLDPNPSPNPSPNPNPSEALRYAGQELRPGLGWRVVSAVLVREASRHLASWYLFDGRRSTRCVGDEQLAPRRRPQQRRRGGGGREEAGQRRRWRGSKAADTLCTPAQWAENPNPNPDPELSSNPNPDPEPNPYPNNNPGPSPKRSPLLTRWVRTQAKRSPGGAQAWPLSP